MKREDVLYAIYRFVAMGSMKCTPTTPYEEEVQRLKELAVKETLRKMFNVDHLGVACDVRWHLDRRSEKELEDFILSHGHLVSRDGSILRVLSQVAGLSAGFFERKFRPLLNRRFRYER